MKRVFLAFVILLLPGGLISAEPLGKVTGRIDCMDQAECRGLAVLWYKDPEAVPDPRRFIVPPVAVTPLQGDGAFELTAAPGDYYVGAFLRKSAGLMPGPPRVGDLIFLTPDPDNRPLAVRIESGKSVATGVHERAWKFAGLTDPSATGVAGQVLDVQRQPVAGLLVFAFADADLSLEPVAVSTRTDADGRFTLPLPKSGSVYLRVRKTYRGGQPTPGDYVGVFGGAVPKALTVSSGTFIDGLMIPVLKIPDLMKRKNAAGTARPRLQGLSQQRP